jgi:hypothetical protein
VIKAYVEKQRGQPSKMARAADKVEVGAVWNAADPDDADKDTLRGGRFFVDLSKKSVPLATAAPGLE